jgi:protein DGCR14
MSNRNKKQRRVVLSEEEYQDTLEKIVERDYFPELPALRRQAIVLERRSIGDVAGAVAVRRAARQLEDHELALQEQEEYDEMDLSHANGQETKTRKRPRPLHRESLSGFHSRVTSEDNEEFDRTQRQEVNDNRERLRLLFSSKPELPQITNGDDSTSSAGSETPLLAADKFAAPAHRIASSEWKETDIGTNGLFFPPQYPKNTAGGELVRKRLPNMPSKVDDNLLMPPPSAYTNQEGVVSSLSAAIALKKDLVEYTPKSIQEKRINPSQTRFTTRQVASMPATSSTAGDGGDSSTDYSTEASTDLDEPARSLSKERRSYAKYRRREQEGFVEMTPLIIPGQNDGTESPIVTWGNVAATPIVLGGRSFALPIESDRDKAARKAENTLENAKRRSDAAKRSRTPLVDRKSTLTPAARSLLDKRSATKRPSSVRSGDAFSAVLRSSYTPKVRSARSLTRDGQGATPRLPSAHPGTADDDAGVVHANAAITDGLLQLPKKAK